MRNTIMTEKIARRGVRVPSEYEADFLDQVLVRDACSRDVVSLRTEQTLDEIRKWIASGSRGSSHQGYPVVDRNGTLAGVLTRRILLDPRQDPSWTLSQLLTRPPAAVFEDSTLREAADHMVGEDVGRLPVVARERPSRVIGFITRGDLLAAHRGRLEASSKPERAFAWGRKAAPKA